MPRVMHIMNDATNPPDAAVWIMRCGCVVVVDEDSGALTPDIDFVGDDRLTVEPTGKVYNTDVHGNVDYVTCARCAEAVT